MPTIVPVDSVSIRIKPAKTKDGMTYINRGIEYANVSWKIEGKSESVTAELLEDGVHLMDLENGANIQRAMLRDDSIYEVRVSAMPLFGAVNQVEPVVETLPFRTTPDVGKLGAVELSVGPLMPDTGETLYIDRDAEAVTFDLSVEGDTDYVKIELLEDGETVRTYKPGETIDRDLLKDGAEYTLRVSAMPKNGRVLGAKPVQQAVTFRLYPPVQPVEGLAIEAADATLKDGVYLLKGTSVNLSWRCDSGDVERYELTVANGDQVIREALERNSYSFTAQNTGDYIVKLVATPRYARSDADNATASAVVRPHFPTVIEKYWPYGVGLLAALIALGVGLYFLRQNKAEHVLGTLHVVCEELSFDKLLTFEGGWKGVKLNHPLTDHPELSKLKGKRAHALLSRIRVDMVVANNLGQVVSNDVDPEQARRILEVKHRPNERLIALKYKNPDGKVEACYVGKYDIGESSIAIEDSGKRYAFVFSGN